ncbi:unnamed protein product [Rotaria magnacalcarata]|uniref:EF-hand domain-containing protein n=1 Tax=Rotaria magnacalcarata TaxID=392030 RepID=A0A815PC03_9BILA|nr:unnamed protein product [Rotaria magnacalcarata]CAF1446841.1 unnamed protein product [Rotaria magnacalcarata]CAF2256959.1 unnamed protein product [Rotaria magnacalcarata]CAF3786995.1 unnamed protein product [Rotaria magnacalcarata]CAF3810463.1 unnamed protein product [Rotaria magnacalcarata]
MAEQTTINGQFDRADINHDGTIDEQEFRQFLGPVRDERRLSGNISQQDIQQIQSQSSHATQTVKYPVGLDVALAGFAGNPIDYEKFTGGSDSRETHAYGVGPDVGIGAPNVARKSHQYDPAGAMFDYADVNHDGKIDHQEFGTFMRSV